MYNLTDSEKLDFIIKTSKKMGIKAHDYADNSEISVMGAHNILNGISKNPRTKKLNIMLEYLTNKVLGNSIIETSELEKANDLQSLKISEEKMIYKPKEKSLDDIIYKRIKNRLQNELDYLQKQIDEIKKTKPNE